MLHCMPTDGGGVFMLPRISCLFGEFQTAACDQHLDLQEVAKQHQLMSTAVLLV